MLTLEEIQIIFKVLDQSGDGNITIEELIHVIQSRIN